MSLILKSSNKQRIPKHKRLLNEDIHKSQWEESKNTHHTVILRFRTMKKKRS